MQTPFGGPVSSPKRQSCDRCHGQKLRCPRPSNGRSGACERCIRSKAQCVYSSSLPKGRPSANRKNMQNANASSVKSSSHRNEATNGEVSFGVDNNSDLAIVTETITVEEQHADQMATVTWDNPMTMDWMEYIDNNLPEAGWADLGYADFCDITIDPPSAPDLSNNIAGEQMQQSSGQAEVHPSSTSKKEEPETAVACLSRLSHRLYSLYSEVLEMVNSPGALDPVDTTALNAGPFANDSAFQTLTGWLVRASSGTVDSSARAGNQENLTYTDGRDGCDVLQDVFSASQDLLNTLHSLNDESSKLSPYPVPQDGPLPLDAAGLLTPQSMSMASNTEDVCPKKLPSSNHWSNSIVRHMVMACHMLLLNTYLAVTMALQHAIDKQKPS